VLDRRAGAFEIQVAAAEALMRAVPPDLPRLFVIEEEYAQAMRKAELEWLRRTIRELKDGTLDWPQMLDLWHTPMS
jgi:hypothetical protein